MNLSAVDLFCGAGGLTYGLERAGIPVSAGVDVDPDCKYPYNTNTNARFVQSDVEPMARRNPERVGSLFDFRPDLKVLAGCAPCQPFSPLNHGTESSSHEKWALLDSFRRLVDDLGPDVVVMENVYEVRNHDVYQAFEEELEDEGYFVNDDNDKRVYCPEYGIPQKRKRWVLLASKEGPISLGEPPFPDEEDYPTVRETIDHLPELEAGEVHSERRIHQARTLSDTNLERIELMEPGADWRIWDKKGRPDLLLECHKKESGSSFKAPYSRVRPDEPAPTITTQFYNYGSGRFGHYDQEQKRALSLLEGAMLQSFPEDYQFVREGEEMHTKKMGRLIGNAVPPKLAEIIGDRIVEHAAEVGGVSPKAVADD
ncbi:DNA cytosine methyltransferase [Halomarina rubra]|uniref:DNA (cytosine-5-)-methyltransferase n=1 Tax=Halomarina rubra TaxID=2071873 RepID=A0ABD6AUA7_9EURY|nr:DNA cytosine methyltransferase [Halomarina rubra]